MSASTSYSGVKLYSFLSWNVWHSTIQSLLSKSIFFLHRVRYPLMDVYDFSEYILGVCVSCRLSYMDVGFRVYCRFQTGKYSGITRRGCNSLWEMWERSSWEIAMGEWRDGKRDYTFWPQTQAVRCSRPTYSRLLTDIYSYVLLLNIILLFTR